MRLAKLHFSDHYTHGTGAPSCPSPLPHGIPHAEWRRYGWHYTDALAG
eukprot:gene13271-1706_t